MIGFFLKKAFFDMWDNLYAIIVLNLGFYIIIAATFGAGYLTIFGLPFILPEDNPIGAFVAIMIILIIGHVLYNVYGSAVSGVTKDIANYEPPSFQAFFGYLKESWKSSALFGLIQGVVGGLFVNAATHYFAGMEDMINVILFFVVVDVYLIWIVASQYYLALQANFDKKVRKNIRKMLLLLLDNTAFTLFGLTFFSILFFAISALTFLLLPGFASILLLQSVALKLRMYKYDYLEENPEANRKKIPWDTLLIEEKDRVGKRTLRSMIFPWKE